MADIDILTLTPEMLKTYQMLGINDITHDVRVNTPMLGLKVSKFKISHNDYYEDFDSDDDFYTENKSHGPFFDENPNSNTNGNVDSETE